MDTNTKPSRVIDAVESSVTSLASSFVQLEIKPSTGDDGPINCLPNELILQIMARLKKKSDGVRAKDDDDYYCFDVKQLIRLRLVSTRWRAIVEYYCQEKISKSLLVNWSRYIDIDFKKSAPVSVHFETVEFFYMMPKLFPNIEQLKVGWFLPQFDNAQIRKIAVNINLLNSLKHLELVGQLMATLPYLSTTLSQLEHIVIDDIFYILTDDDLLRIVSHLGPKCARLYLGEVGNLDYNRILQWHNIKPQLFANLTHLQILIESSNEDYTKVIHFLGVNANSLKLLYFYAWNNSPLSLTPTVIDDLGKMSNLTELELWNISMNIPLLEEAVARHRITSLSSVLTCELYINRAHPIDADKFTRVLSVIFPKLVLLDLHIGQDYSTSRRFVRQIKQHLDRFPNLRKHEIDFWK